MVILLLTENVIQKLGLFPLITYHLYIVLGPNK